MIIPASPISGYEIGAKSTLRIKGRIFMAAIYVKIVQVVQQPLSLAESESALERTRTSMDCSTST